MSDSVQSESPYDPLTTNSRSNLTTSPLTALAWILAISFALFVRIWNLSGQSLWTDEMDSLMQSQTLADIWPNRGNGVLYFLTLHFWRACFGDSITAIRSYSVFLSLFGLLGITWMGMRLGGRRTALKTLIVAAGLPLLVWHARDARMYTLWGFGFLVTWNAVLDFRDRGATPSAIIQYALGNLIGILSHNYHAFFALGFSAAAWIYSVNSTAGPRQWLKLHSLVFVGAAAYLIRIGTLSPHVAQYLSTWAEANTGFRPIQSFGEVVFYFTPGVNTPQSTGLGLCIAIVIGFAAYFLYSDPKWEKSSVQALFCILFLPFFLIHALPIRDYGRLLYPTALTLPVLLAWASESRAWRNLKTQRRVWSSVVALGSIVLALTHVLHVKLEPWDEACKFAEQYDPQTTLLITENRSAYPPLKQCAELKHTWIHHWGEAQTYMEAEYEVPRFEQVILMRSAPWISGLQSLRPLLEDKLQAGNEFPLGPFLTMKHFQRRPTLQKKQVKLDTNRRNSKARESL